MSSTHRTDHYSNEDPVKRVKVSPGLSSRSNLIWGNCDTDNTKTKTPCRGQCGDQEISNSGKSPSPEGWKDNKKRWVYRVQKPGLLAGAKTMAGASGKFLGQRKEGLPGGS